MYLRATIEVYTCIIYYNKLCSSFVPSLTLVIPPSLTLLSLTPLSLLLSYPLSHSYIFPHFCHVGHGKGILVQAPTAKPEHCGTPVPWSAKVYDGVFGVQSGQESNPKSKWPCFCLLYPFPTFSATVFSHPPFLSLQVFKTFDPLMFLSLPLPARNANFIFVVVIRADPKEHMVKVQCIKPAASVEKMCVHVHIALYIVKAKQPTSITT